MTQSPLCALLVASDSLSLTSSGSPTLYTDQVTLTAKYTSPVSDTVTFTEFLVGTIGTASMVAGLATFSISSLAITQIFYPGLGGHIISARLSSGASSGFVIQPVIFPQRLAFTVSFIINGFTVTCPVEAAIVVNDTSVGVEGDVFALQGSSLSRADYWTTTLQIPVSGIGDLPGLPGDTITSVVVQAAVMSDSSSTTIVVFIQPTSGSDHQNYSQVWTASGGQLWQRVIGNFSYSGAHSPTPAASPSSDPMLVVVSISSTGHLSESITVSGSGTVS